MLCAGLKYRPRAEVGTRVDQRRGTAHTVIVRRPGSARTAHARTVESRVHLDSGGRWGRDGGKTIFVWGGGRGESWGSGNTGRTPTVSHLLILIRKAKYVATHGEFVLQI